MRNTRIPGRSGFGLVELVVSVVILSLLYLVVSKTMFRKPGEEATRQELKSEGMDASDTPGMIGAAKSKVSAFNEAARGRGNEYKSQEE